jgi:hypothetical protein
MRIDLGIALAAALVGLSANAASARDVKISGTHSVSDIEMHCIDNNGTFFNAPGGGYGCAGSGGGTVTCTGKGKCTGTVSKVTGGGASGGKGRVGHPVNVIAPNRPVSVAGPPSMNPGKPGGMSNEFRGGGMHQGHGR